MVRDANSSFPVNEEDSGGFQESTLYDTIFQIVLVLGLVGNSINLAVLSRPSLRGVTYVYLFWLAISDFAYLAVNVAVYVVEWFDPELLFTYGVMFAMCHFTFALSNMFATSSAFIVTVLTIDRHRAVSEPLRPKNKVIRRRPAITIACAIALAVVLYVPVTFQTMLQASVLTRVVSLEEGGGSANHSETLYSCKISPVTDLAAFKVYVYCREIISRVAPIVLVTLLNVRIILALKRHQQDREDLACSAERERVVEERRLVKLLIAIVLMFLVCTTPQMLSWMLVSKDAIETSALFNVFDSISDLLIAVNAASNFYLYCFCSKAVRRVFLQMLRSAGRLFPTHLTDLSRLLTSSSASQSRNRKSHTKLTVHTASSP